MKYINAELIKSTKDLYNDIDSCIGELIKARFDHNQENEGKALFRMEGLMVATLQQLDCIIDSLQQEPIEKDEETEKLIVCDIIEATIARINGGKKDEEKEENIMREKIAYLRDLGLKAK